MNEMPPELANALTAWVLKGLISSFFETITERASDGGVISVEQLMELNTMAAAELAEAFDGRIDS